MIGDRIRELREQRAWTQVHLADASGVSLRTIQRLERMHSCSSETLLSLAAALDVDVQCLTDARYFAAPPAALRATRPATIVATLLMLPGLLFVSVNLLKFSFGWSTPYDFAARLGSRLPLAPALISPVVIAGGPAVALALIAAVAVRLRTERTARSFSVTGVEVAAEVLPLGVALCAAAALASLGVYLAAENFVGLVR
jgi:transcriptional regulator with XRE-family HTH domain